MPNRKVWLSTEKVPCDYSGATAPDSHRLLRYSTLLPYDRAGGGVNDFTE
ncbi:hypothetical protein L284_11645 [Novosphingobium lindaniclasticum LE124]|uniref:Uncharacterized protein n=1 Tax=Novosphingobium lindaniclasticum LE124 TaxID=1096930 RepID=T0HQF3_9SPHN|nr:hypothetical protein L284_11645 [Novosphingobium lindaniclasticum LE124]